MQRTWVCRRENLAWIFRRQRPAGWQQRGTPTLLPWRLPAAGDTPRNSPTPAHVSMGHPQLPRGPQISKQINEIGGVTHRMPSEEREVVVAGICQAADARRGALWEGRRRPPTVLRRHAARAAATVAAAGCTASAAAGAGGEHAGAAKAAAARVCWRFLRVAAHPAVAPHRHARTTSRALVVAWPSCPSRGGHAAGIALSVR